MASFKGWVRKYSVSRDQASGTLFEDLSEQFLVDCAYGHSWEGLEGNGCEGGWPQAYFDFVLNTVAGGMQTETAYPYTADQGGCRATAEGKPPGPKQTFR
jgi:hypothetical protein